MLLVHIFLRSILICRFRYFLWCLNWLWLLNIVINRDVIKLLHHRNIFELILSNRKLNRILMLERLILIHLIRIVKSCWLILNICCVIVKLLTLDYLMMLWHISHLWLHVLGLLLIIILRPWYIRHIICSVECLLLSHLLFVKVKHQFLLWVGVVTIIFEFTIFFCKIMSDLETLMITYSKKSVYILPLWSFQDSCLVWKWVKIDIVRIIVIHGKFLERHLFSFCLYFWEISLLIPWSLFCLDFQVLFPCLVVFRWFKLKYEHLELHSVAGIILKAYCPNLSMSQIYIILNPQKSAGRLALIQADFYRIWQLANLTFKRQSRYFSKYLGI